MAGDHVELAEPSDHTLVKCPIFHRRSDDAVLEHQARSPDSFPTAFNIAAADSLPNRFWTRRM